jgi:hypothetical protein
MDFRDESRLDAVQVFDDEDGGVARLLNLPDLSVQCLQLSSVE